MLTNKSTSSVIGYNQLIGVEQLLFIKFAIQIIWRYLITRFRYCSDTWQYI